MTTITAKFIEDDGRKWYAVTLPEDAYGLEAGTHVFGLTTDGDLLDSDGCPENTN